MPSASKAWPRGLRRSPPCPILSGAFWRVFERPNGLVIDRVATPLGVIGVIFESRPAVAADAGALCLKSGNAAILRGGSESFHSVALIHACLHAGLKAAGLPAAAITLVPVKDRAAVGEMLTGLGGNIDVIVPRGGKSLVARVEAEARVPVFAHLEGLVHVYVDRDADLDKALVILRNSKLRRTSVCGAAETLLVDRACAATHLAPLVKMLLDAGCAVRGDAATLAVDPRVDAGDGRRLVDANISMRSFPCASSMGSTPRSRISRIMARITPIASSPKTRGGGALSDAKSIPPSSSTMPRRNLPTAASSASAARSALRRGGCMRAARSASNN